MIYDSLMWRLMLNSVYSGKKMDSIFSSLQKMTRYTSQLNYREEVTSPEKCKVILPGGLHCEAFQKSDGKPTLASVFELMESARHFMIWPSPQCVDREGLYVDYLGSMTDSFLVTGSARMVINRSIYQAASPKYPLTVTTELNYIGKSSFCSSSVLACPNNNNCEYARCTVQNIQLDVKTKTPVQFPEWWRKRHGPFVKNGSPLIIARSEKPQDVHVSQMSIQHEHTDYNLHTNWISYIRFCLNACMHAVLKQQYHKLTQDIVNNGVKEFEIKYMAESGIGDVLDVISWEASEKGVINFELRNRHSVCCYAIMKFYLSKRTSEPHTERSKI